MNNELETESSPAGVSFQEYLAILRRRRAIILQAFVLITVVGAVITLLTRPVYHASAKLLVDGPSYNLNTIDTTKGPLAYRLPPDQVVALDLQTPPRARELAEAVCQRRPTGPGDEAPLYDCSAGETAFHVNPYGEMTPCIMTRRGGYDLRIGTFDEAWHHVFSKMRTRTRRCAEDEPTGYHHCAGWAQLENDSDAERAVAHAALVARLRGKAFARTDPARRYDALLMPIAPVPQKG